jgi:hypothetical protein
MLCQQICAIFTLMRWLQTIPARAVPMRGRAAPATTSFDTRRIDDGYPSLRSAAASGLPCARSRLATPVTVRVTRRGSRGVPAARVLLCCRVGQGAHQRVYARLRRTMAGPTRTCSGAKSSAHRLRGFVLLRHQCRDACRCALSPLLERATPAVQSQRMGEGSRRKNPSPIFFRGSFGVALSHHQGVNARLRRATGTGRNRVRSAARALEDDSIFGKAAVNFASGKTRTRSQSV